MRKTLLLLVVGLGLALRIIGADWGFPFLLHPDENVVANMPVAMAVRASLDPEEYNHPDHFDIYANAVIYHTASNLLFHKPLTKTFGEHTLRFYHMSRIFVALLGTLCILVAYLVGREYSEDCGLVAATLVAVFPPYVNHSHYITADIPLALFTFSVLLFTIRYLKAPSRWNLWAALFLCALSVSVKYPGVLNLPLVLAAVTYRRLDDRKLCLKELAQSLAVFTISLLAVSPYLLINFDKVVQALTANANPVHLGADGLGWTGNLIYYAGTFYDAAGTFLTIFFLAGAVLVVKREKQLALPLFLGLVYWVALSKIGLHWERWALPMYTCPLMVAAYGIDWAFKKSRLSSKRFFTPLLAAAAALALFNLLAASTALTATYTLPDTRYASYQFTQLKGIKETTALYEGFTPFYPGNLRDGSALNAYYTIDRKKTVESIILSSGVYDRYRQEPDRYAAENQFYDFTFKLPLIAKFAPKEYLSDPDEPFYLKSELAKNLAFLTDYLLHKNELLSGPTILIYKYETPGFLEQAGYAARRSTK